MSIQAQNTELNIVPGGIIPVVHISQYDVGRVLSFKLYDKNSEASLDNGTTATIEGTKPDGNGFSYDCNISNNIVSVETTEQMTVLSGAIECKITLFNGSDRIGTALFILDVEKAGLNSDTPISETEIPPIIALAREQEQNAEAWAVGTKNGEPVSEDDPQYENSSKWWAEYAESTVTGVTGVKGNAETDYRRGNVNLTPANIGALATDGDSEDNTVTYTSSDNDATTEKTSDGFTSVATMASGETHASLFQKISKMFLNIRKLWNTVGTSALASGKTVTGLLGNTDISSVGSTVTGAISKLGNQSWKSDSTYPSCLYRMNGTAKEWLNPPLFAGVEYRTIERFNGKPVYVYVYHNTTDIASGQQQATLDISNVDAGIRIEGYSVSTGDAAILTIPYKYSTASIHATLWRNSAGTAFKIYFDSSEAIRNGYFAVYYTKTTD